jgi:Tfp pilus assembly protein PilZ
MDRYDRRHSPRQRKEAAIKVLLIPDDLKSSKDSWDLSLAKMINQSDNGLYIEIDRDLQPGSNVRIKMVAPEGYYPEEAYYMRDGQVIWCEKVDDNNTRFGVGIKILRKVIQTHVLTSRFK